MAPSVGTPVPGANQTQLLEDLQASVVHLTRENEELRRDKNSFREHSDELRRIMAGMREELQALEREKGALQSDFITQMRAAEALEDKLVAEKEENERLHRVIREIKDRPRTARKSRSEAPVMNEPQRVTKGDSADFIPKTPVHEDKNFEPQIKEEPIDIEESDVSGCVVLKRSRSPSLEIVDGNQFALNRKRTRSSVDTPRPSPAPPKVDPCLPLPELSVDSTRRVEKKPRYNDKVLPASPVQKIDSEDTVPMSPGRASRSRNSPTIDCTKSETADPQNPSVIIPRFKKDDAFDLPVSEKEAHLKGVPTFQIIPAPNAVAVKRVVMGMAYGGSNCHLVQRISPGKNPSSYATRQLVWPSPDSSPAVPQVPGQPGLMFAARSELREGVWSTFVRNNNKKSAEWLYLGEYKNTLVGTLTKEQFVWQSEKVKQSWAKRVATKKSPSYQAIRDRILERKGRPITEADIREAFDCGHEGVPILRTQCVAYDRIFIYHVENAHKRAVFEKSEVRPKRQEGFAESNKQGMGVARKSSARKGAALERSADQSAQSIGFKSLPRDRGQGNESDGGLSYMSDTPERP